MLKRRFETLTEKIDFILFRQQLLFDNDDLSRILFEYEVSEKEYKTIMDLMEAYRETISEGRCVNHGEFEAGVYAIVPHLLGNYHFCEEIAKAFRDQGRWEEVFSALYGNLPKFRVPEA